MRCLEHLSGSSATPTVTLIRAGAFSWSDNESQSLETLISDVLSLCTVIPGTRYAVFLLLGDCMIF